MTDTTQDPQGDDHPCDWCDGKGWALAQRDDGTDAVERCDACTSAPWAVATDAEASARARPLLRAAPAMLHALWQCRGALEDMGAMLRSVDDKAEHEEFWTRGWVWDEAERDAPERMPHPAWHQAAAAIAQATGETPQALNTHPPVYQLVAIGTLKSLDCSGSLRSGVFLSRASAERGIPTFKVACTTSKNKAQELATLSPDGLRVEIVELPVVGTQQALNG